MEEPKTAEIDDYGGMLVEADYLNEYRWLRAECDYLKERYEHQQTRLKFMAATRPELADAFIAINQKNEYIRDFQEKKAVLLELQGRIAKSFDMDPSEMEREYQIDTESGLLMYCPGDHQKQSVEDE